MIRFSQSGPSAGSFDEIARQKVHLGEAASASLLKAGAGERNGGIDALRAAVVLLVVFHHAALTYGAIGGWYYREIAPSSSPASLLLILFCTANQAWFMGPPKAASTCRRSFTHSGSLSSPGASSWAC
jgi:hypothetical protein